MKYVLVIAVVFVVAWLIRGSRTRKGGPAARGPAAPEGMLSCAHCGVHLPSSEAIVLRDRAYCSAAHRDAGPRA